MVPGRKFSSRTSLFFASLRRTSRPSGAFRFRVMLFLLRFTDMKYVDSPPTNGGQLRVSSPLPGSSTLITSAPMSPSIIAQKGPARTPVRSSTRTPASGPLAFATESSFPGALREALRDRAHALTGSARAAPEELRAIERAEVREVVDVANRLDGHPRANLEPLGLVAVAAEPRAADQIDQRDVKRRAEALGRREQRRERDDLTATHHRGRRTLDRMARTPA